MAGSSNFISPLKNFSVPLMIILISTVLSFLHRVECVEFDVGGKNGWATPSGKNNDQVYNDWASKNRFQVNDTLRFGYKKDSVLVVTEEEYEKCRSSHPIFFSNNGDTVFTLDRPGLFYFISGVAGHCQKGLKMIVKVLEPASPPQAANEHSSAALVFAAPEFIPMAVFVLISSFIGVIFV
ncbi:hypothetical protein DH2020_022344 [Rehmannia glutinosa]|uniref:Phytocyanin domain-containing protein n=1 Tax=Rehmannia glutinosa TaxID=99300 RepID=A0ABR0WEL1_REHGL